MHSARELVNLQFDKSPSIIEEGILNNNSILVIGGPPKSYKSFLVKTMCMHLATGTNLFGATRAFGNGRKAAFIISQPCRVLYLEQEIGTESLKARVLKIASNLNGTQDAFFDNFYSHSTDRDLRLDNQEGAMAIGQLVERSKADVLVLDPLIEFHSADENSSHDMSVVLRGIDAIRAQFKVATIIVHHAGKPSSDRYGPDSLRGSSILYGKVDTVFMVEVYNRAGGIIKVSPTLRRDKPLKPFLLRMDWPTLTYQFYDWFNSTSGKKATAEPPQNSDDI